MQRALLKLYNMREYPDLRFRSLKASIRPKIITSSYITLNNFVSIDHYWVTGFCDGEGCFYLRIRENVKSKIGWSVELVFYLHIHIKDKALLQAIQKLFGGIGNISNNGKKAVQFQVTSIKEIGIIIDHFDKYSLITQKWSDYQLFKMAFYIVKNKEHLTLDGIKKLVAIKSSLNKGLPENFKESFPNVEPISRPSVENKKIINPNWLAGFISAEGCFFCSDWKVI